MTHDRESSAPRIASLMLSAIDEIASDVASEGIIAQTEAEQQAYATVLAIIDQKTKKMKTDLKERGLLV